VFYISQTSTPIKKFNGNINEAGEKLVLLVVVIYQMLTQYFTGVTFWQRARHLEHVINT
jgi:hypothetical protein